MTRAIDVDRVKREIRKNKEKIVISCKQKYVPLSLIYEILNKAPTLTPPNEPLTLEQLREMDGEPVYCINIDDYSTKEWMIVGKDDCEGRRYIFDFSTYSRNWLAYRHPPEGEV